MRLFRSDKLVFNKVDCGFVCGVIGVAGAWVGIGLVFGTSPIVINRALNTIRWYGSTNNLLGGDEEVKQSEIGLVFSSDLSGYRVVDRLLMFFWSQFKFRVVSIDSSVRDIHLVSLIYTPYDQSKLLRSLRLLRGSAGFGILIDTCGVDLMGVDRFVLYGSVERKVRFGVIYQFASLETPIRVFVHALLGPKMYGLLSAVKEFEGMNWLEREIYDMFGIVFIEHPNLRRILTDYGFIGFPLRKDFPVSGYSEVRFDKEVQSLVYDRVVLQQKGRLFEFEYTV